jgi:hypothetical protein
MSVCQSLCVQSARDNNFRWAETTCLLRLPPFSFVLALHLQNLQRSFRSWACFSIWSEVYSLRLGSEFLTSMTLPEDQLARSSLPHLNCVYLLTQRPASSRFQGLSRIPRRRTFCGKHLLYLQKATNRMSSQTFSLICLALSGTPGNQSITANRPRARCHPSLKISLSCSRQVFVWATCHNHHLPVRHHQLIVHSNCYRTAQVSDMTFAITQLLLVRLSNWCSCRSKILF